MNKLILLALVICTNSASAFGISCSNPSDRTERLVCKDPTLRSLNTKLIESYEKSKDRTSDEEVLKEVQGSWVSSLRELSNSSKSDDSVQQSLRSAFKKQIQFLESPCVLDVHVWGAKCSCDDTDKSIEVCGTPVKEAVEEIHGWSCSMTMQGHRSAVYECGPKIKVLMRTGGACESDWHVYEKGSGGFTLKRVIEHTEVKGVCVSRTRTPPSNVWRLDGRVNMN
jgi:uncharacterized protein